MINYRQGFFPFPILDESLLPAVPEKGYFLEGISLAGLTKCWWLAKSYDFSFNLSYSLTSGAVGSRLYDVGTTTGSGTVLCVGGALANGPYAATPPGARVTIGEDVVWLPTGGGMNDLYVFGPPMTITNAGNLSFESGSPAPDTYSQASSLTDFAHWFWALTAINGQPNTFIFKTSAGEYKSCISGYLGPCGSSSGGQIGIGSAGAPGTTYHDIAAVLRLKITGETDVLIPLHIETDYDDVDSVTGEVVLNFNNFWTP